MYKNPILDFLILSLDFLCEHQVHVKQSRFDPKVLFLVYTMLNFVFLIQNKREAKCIVLL